MSQTTWYRHTHIWQDEKVNDRSHLGVTWLSYEGSQRGHENMMDHRGVTWLWWVMEPETKKELFDVKFYLKKVKSYIKLSLCFSNGLVLDQHLYIVVGALRLASTTHSKAWSIRRCLNRLWHPVSLVLHALFPNLIRLPVLLEQVQSFAFLAYTMCYDYKCDLREWNGSSLSSRNQFSVISMKSFCSSPPCAECLYL